MTVCMVRVPHLFIAATEDDPLECRVSTTEKCEKGTPVEGREGSLTH